MAKRASDRKFGFTIAVFFLVLATWRLNRGQKSPGLALALAAAFLATAYVCPRILGPLNRAWFKLGLLLNQLVSPIVLALMYFVVITPAALLLRLCGVHLLNHESGAEADTYWRKRQSPSPESMRRQF